MLLKCLLIFTLIVYVQSANILVVSTSVSKSRQIVFCSLIQELIKRNHEVTAITTEPVYLEGVIPNNLKEINLHNLTYHYFKNASVGLEIADQSNLAKMRATYRWLSRVFFEQLKDDSVQKLLSDKTMKFELVVAENCIPSTLIFSHIFKAPVIFMSGFGALPGNMRMIGSVTHPLLYPTHYHQKLYNHTLWERIRELFIEIAYNDLHEKQESDDDVMLKSHFGIGTPTLDELKNNIHMMFLNVHPIWIHNQPVPQNVFYIWGLHKNPVQILPKDLQSYLDSSQRGVIYISFGSIFKTTEIPLDTLNIFLKVFSRLPNNILWKWDSAEMPGKSDNIRISKWFPQNDLLRHPNVKLFITHGGLRSTEESINANVPLIGIPQFSDQEYNTEKYSYFKIGIRLDYKSLTAEKLEMAIKTILTNYNSYKRNVIKLRTLMHDQPKPVSEQAVWWIEYMLRHGGVQHLRAPAANMSWTEYYELELGLLFLAGSLVLLIALLATVYTCLHKIIRLIKLKMNHRNVSKSRKTL